MPHEGIPHDVGLSELDFLPQTPEEKELVLQAILARDDVFASPEQAELVRNSPASVRAYIRYWFQDHPGIPAAVALSLPIFTEGLADFVFMAQIQFAIEQDLFNDDKVRIATLGKLQELVAEHRNEDWFKAGIDSLKVRAIVIGAGADPDDIVTEEFDDDVVVSDAQWKSFFQFILDKHDLNPAIAEYLFNSKSKLVTDFRIAQKAGTFPGSFLAFAVIEIATPIKDILDGLDRRILSNDPIIDPLINEAYEGMGLDTIEHSDFIRGVMKDWMGAQMDIADPGETKLEVWNRFDATDRDHQLDLVLQGKFAGLRNADVLFELLDSNGQTLIGLFRNGDIRGETFREFLQGVGGEFPDVQLQTRVSEEQIGMAAFIAQNFGRYARGLDSFMYRAFTARMQGLFGRMLADKNVTSIDSGNFNEAILIITSHPDFNPNRILNEVIMDNVANLKDRDLSTALLESFGEVGDIGSYYKELDISDSSSPQAWERDLFSRLGDLIPEEGDALFVSKALADIFRPRTEGFSLELQEVAAQTASEIFRNEMLRNPGVSEEDILNEIRFDIGRQIDTDLRARFDESSLLFIDQVGGFVNFFRRFPSFGKMQSTDINDAINTIVFAEEGADLSGADPRLIAAFMELKSDPAAREVIDRLRAPIDEAARLATEAEEEIARREKEALLDEEERQALTEERERVASLRALDVQSAQRIESFFGEFLTAAQARIAFQDFGQDLSRKLAVSVLDENRQLSGEDVDFSSLDIFGADVGFTQLTPPEDLANAFNTGITEGLDEDQITRLDEFRKRAQERGGRHTRAVNRATRSAAAGFTNLGLNTRAALGFLRQAQQSRMRFRTPVSRRGRRVTSGATSTRIQ